MADFVYYLRSDSFDDNGTGTEDDPDQSNPNRAFKTFNGAEAALQGTIAAGDRVIVNVRAGTYNEALTVDGSTINGQWIWRALIGHEHLGVAGAGVVMTQSASFTSTIYQRDNNLIYEDIELRNTSTTGGSRSFWAANSPATLRRCILGPNSSTNVPNTTFEATDLGDQRVEACLICETTVTNTAALNFGNFVPGRAICCTVVKNNNRGVLRTATGPQETQWWNTVAYGNTVADFDVPGTNVVADYCASGDATAPGANSSLNISDPFTDYANGDYSISGTGSALYDAGEGSNRPTADSYGNANLDITKTVYPQNDIGCYAYVAAGPPDLALEQTMAGIATAVSWEILFDLSLSLDATLPGVGSVDWNASVDYPLDVTLPGAASTNWDLFEEGAQDFPLATTLAGIGTAAGWTAGVESSIAATWPGGSSQDWGVATELTLAVTLTAAATIDWNAALELPLATTLAGAGTIDWSIEGENGLVAQMNGVATALDWNLGWEAVLANTFPGAATVNWDLIHDVPGDEMLAGTFSGVASTPAWSAIPELPLASSFPGVGIAAAWNLSLDSDLTLATTLAGVANAVDWNAGLEQTLATTLPGIGTQDWNLSGDETLAATLPGVATPDWYGSLDFPLYITLSGLTNVDDWSISRGGLDIPIFATAVRDVTPWPTVVDL